MRFFRDQVEIPTLRWKLYVSLHNILDIIVMTILDLRLREPSSYFNLGIVLHETGLTNRRMQA